MGTLISLLVLSFLIFFHELGHFLAARFFGVHVEVFSIGFGKKVFSRVYKETEYALSMIPLGGYVKMKGQDDTDPTKVSDDKDSYNVKKPWQRIIILLAGPFANFLLAFFLYIAIGNIGITKFAPIVGQVAKESPALKSGIKSGDEIVAIDGLNIKTWDDLSKKIRKSNTPLLFKIKRDGKVLQLRVLPKIDRYKNMFGEIMKKKMVGISPNGKTIMVKYTLLGSILFALDETKNATTIIVKGLQKLIEGVVPAKELGGIVSIVQVTAKASSVGIVALLGLTALISVNLGVLNLLPIPALDGGHIMFNLYEMVTGRAPSERVLYYLTLAGWAFLLSLMVFTVFNDIYRIAGGK